MPCRDYFEDHPEQYFKDVTEPALKRQISFAESALCLTLAMFRKFMEGVKHDYDDRAKTNPLDVISDEEFADAGITRKDLEKWWDEHKHLDAIHREQERLRKVRDEALRKLTQEEQQALGIEVKGLYAR